MKNKIKSTMSPLITSSNPTLTLLTIIISLKRKNNPSKDHRAHGRRIKKKLIGHSHKRKGLNLMLTQRIGHLRICQKRLKTHQERRKSTIDLCQH